MTIYSSLKTLITKNPKTTRSFFTAATTTTTASPIQCPYNPLLSLHHRYPFLHYSPLLLSKWIGAPFQSGPLFLSCPPWKLSQSATPLYMRGKGCVVLRKVEVFNMNLKNSLNLLGNRVGSGVTSQGVLDRVEDLKREDGFLESFVNLPNVISFSRLLSGPLLAWMITNEMYSYAFVGLAISGASDWMDGYVARKMRINSVVGSYLDPLADKVLIGSVALAMVHMNLLHPGLVGLVVLRDVALVGGAAYHRASSLGWKWSSWYDFSNLDGTHPEKVEPLFISKVNTVLQLALVAAALLQPEFGTEETQSYITYLSWLVASTTVASATAYGAKYMGNRSAFLARKS